MLVGEPVKDQSVRVIKPEDARGGELRKIIIDSCCTLNDQLKSAFNAFDKKQNGKVKLSAIGDVLREAG